MKKTDKPAVAKARRKSKGTDASISEAPDVAGSYSEIRNAVGRQVASLRTKQQLKASELASRAGISVALLSRLEHGDVSPSLKTLAQLAEALGVPFPVLFQQVDDKKGASLVPAGQGLSVQRAGSSTGQRYELLGMPIDGEVQVEPYLITIDEKAQPKTSFQHEGVELIYVIDGGIVYRHGSNSYELREGDSLFFDARLPHGPEKFLAVPTRFLSFISYRRH